jgi:hypothetical protein
MKQHQEKARKGKCRRSRIFRELSMILGTKTPVQVKAHHQKLEIKCKDIEGIILYVEAILPQVAAFESQVAEAEEAEERLIKNVSVQCNLLDSH